MADSPPQDVSNDAAEMDDGQSVSPKVRRRNRMITSCLECRRRKLKCDKLKPCTNCSKFSRKCNFLAPALDSVSQQKLNDIKEKMGSLEKVLENNVARRDQGRDRSGKERKSSIDLPGEDSSTDDAPEPEDEKGLEPTPLATQDASYEDDANDDVLDLGIRIGKMRMTERLGGYFRPKMSEELGYTLSDPDADKRTDEEKAAGVPQLPDDAHDFLEPGPSYIPPNSGMLFGDVGPRKTLVDFLPTKDVSDLLSRKYHENVHFVARVFHWPSFQLQYENFWHNVLAGIEPPASRQAVVMAVLFSAVASMPEDELIGIFGGNKRAILSNFQKGTEFGLSKAQFLRTTKVETMQALVAYLIPMCRDQMSRAHSVLVGTAIRLAECMGLHRDPQDVYGLPPVDCQVRRMIWFELCFLDFRTGEIQGPRPCIRREDYDTRFPLNIDDKDLMSGRVEESNTRFTDMTLSRIRFECNEMHRIIWYDRLRLEKKKITLTHVLGKIVSFLKAMNAKYQPILDVTVPIQQYAHLALRVLLNRMHVMVLHRYVNNPAVPTPERLRDLVIDSSIKQVEAAIQLEIRPAVSQWKWYNGAHQQWHTAFLLLTTAYQRPDSRWDDSIWDICDFVFEPDLSLSRTQKARTIIAAIRDRTAVYRDIRRMRAPLSMRGPAVKHVMAPPRFRATKLKQSPLSEIPRDVPDAMEVSPSSLDEVASSKTTPQQWTFDSPSTMLFNDKGYASITSLPGIGQKQKAEYDTTAFQFSKIPAFDFSSPSGSSGASESWPPPISNDQGPWRPAHTSSPSLQSEYSTSHDPNFVNPTNTLAQPSLYPGGAMPQILQTTPGDESMMLDIDWVSRPAILENERLTWYRTNGTSCFRLTSLLIRQSKAASALTYTPGQASIRKST